MLSVVTLLSKGGMLTAGKLVASIVVMFLINYIEIFFFSLSITMFRAASLLGEKAREDDEESVKIKDMLSRA